MATVKGNERPLSEVSAKILETLKGATEPMTVADLKASGIETANGSHLKALESRGFVESSEVEVEVLTIRKVKAYRFIG
jgi:hypothetical protein